MVKGGGLEGDTGWRLILVGSMSNLAFKAAVVSTLGHRRLRRTIFTVFGVALAGGFAILAFWPS